MFAQLAALTLPALPALPARCARPALPARQRPAAPRLRPATAADAAAMQAFVDGLSGASRRWRFHGALGRCSAALALRLVAGDPGRQAVWLACVVEATLEGDVERIVGEARYVVDTDGSGEAELAIAVADDWQGRGVADALMHQLQRSARRAGLRGLHGDVLDGNARMQAFMHRHGFAPVWCDDAEGLRLQCRLRSPAAALWARCAGRVGRIGRGGRAGRALHA